MSESLADRLQAARDNGDEWAEPVPAPVKQRSERRKLAAMVSVRFAPEELEALQAFAKQQGVTVSGYLRHLALQHVGGASAVLKINTYSLVPVDARDLIQQYRSTVDLSSGAWGPTWGGSAPASVAV